MTGRPKASMTNWGAGACFVKWQIQPIKQKFALLQGLAAQIKMTLTLIFLVLMSAGAARTASAAAASSSAVTASNHSPA
jgi:hypothetical protein